MILGVDVEAGGVAPRRVVVLELAVAQRRPEAELETLEAHVVAGRELVDRAVEAVEAKAFDFAGHARLVARRQLEPEASLRRGRKARVESGVERLERLVDPAGDSLRPSLEVVREEDAHDLVGVSARPPLEGSVRVDVVGQPEVATRQAEDLQVPALVGTPGDVSGVEAPAELPVHSLRAPDDVEVLLVDSGECEGPPEHDREHEAGAGARRSDVTHDASPGQTVVTDERSRAH